MAKAVSNEALWEKLSEIDKKLDQASFMQKTPIPLEDQEETKPDFQKEKDEIITEIKEQAYKLGKHGDVNFDANRKKIEMLDENMRKALNIVSRIRKQQGEAVEPKIESKEGYFNFRFFKIRKTSLIIAVLGLLVFILTVFCMKQQNDYALLMDEFYRKSIVIRELQTEVASLRAAVQQPELVKKRR